MSRKCRMIVLVAMALGSSAFGTGVATAASTNNWACDATAARVGALEAGKVQAPGAPCATHSAAVVDAAGLTGLAGATDYVLGINTGNFASAESTVAAANVTVAGVNVRARALHAAASLSCSYIGAAFGTMPWGASQTHEVVVNGAPVPTGDAGAAHILSVGPLATLYLNRKVVTPDGITQRALELVVAGNSVLVLAEARARLINQMGCFDFDGGGELIPVPGLK